LIGYHKPIYDNLGFVTCAMDDMKALGNVLVRLRRQKRLDQRQVAKAAKLSVAHFNRIEKGIQRSVTLPVIQRIASVFGLKGNQIALRMEKVMKLKGLSSRLHRPSRPKV
jgi:transcriptional regulator with XRE-family HTH domain